jgi:hypothetical protein
MGVEAHRVMMTGLMHEILSTADLTPTAWDDFNREYSAAKILSSQNIVRAATDDRFTCFSWSTGLNSYTGYIAANSIDKNKIIVPYRANNTGNFLGWYEVQGKGTNATPVVSGIYDLKGNSYVMNGELNTNDATLNNRFALYSTPGNAVIYIDYVRANQDATITAEKGGLMAISVDELTKTKRTFYTDSDQKLLDGSTLTYMDGNWLNIDNAVGIVVPAHRQFAFGERSNNNSVMTARLYALYSNGKRTVKANEHVAQRAIAYYSNTDAATTQQMSQRFAQLGITEGWNGVIAFDPDETAYLLLANFASDQKCQLSNLTTALGAPVFSEKTLISNSEASATFMAEENHSVANVLRFFIEGTGLEAVQEKDNDAAIYLLNQIKGENTISVYAAGKKKQVVLGQKVIKISIVGGELLVEEAAGFPEETAEDLTQGYKEITGETLVNASFEEDETYAKADGNATCDAGTFNPCYVNTVAAANSKWPNILPVKGWTSGNALSGGSNFCRMYSMPYSMTQYCVSPKAVGNYAARCSRPVYDENCGNRVLTVLNSWDSGSNAITQSVTLPAGQYRLLLDARMECPNLTANNGKAVSTSGNNTCTSLTGIKIGTKTDYRYPTEKNSWQQLCYDFELTGEQAVTFSLGFKTSASAGAANNTLLYLDNLRLLTKEEDTNGIRQIQRTNASAAYDLQGRQIQNMAAYHGIYIVKGKKAFMK